MCLRTTHDVVDRTGLLALSPDFDTVGLLARDPDLLATAAGVLLDDPLLDSPLLHRPLLDLASASLLEHRTCSSVWIRPWRRRSRSPSATSPT